MSHGRAAMESPPWRAFLDSYGRASMVEYPWRAFLSDAPED